MKSVFSLFLLSAAITAAQVSIPWTDVDKNGAKLSDIPTRSAADVGLGALTNDPQVKRSEMGTASGVATLDTAGKLVASQVPDIALTDYLGSASSEAAMLELSGWLGDWCTRSDLGTSWIITGNDPTQLSSWTQLAYPAAPVSSVAGKTGAVSLTASDVGLGPTASPTFAGLNVVSSTTTQTSLFYNSLSGATNILNVALSRAGVANGYARLLWQTAAGTEWSLGTRAGSSAMTLWDEVNNAAAFTIEPGSRNVAFAGMGSFGSAVTASTFSNGSSYTLWTTSDYAELQSSAANGLRIKTTNATPVIIQTNGSTTAATFSGPDMAVAGSGTFVGGVGIGGATTHKLQITGTNGTLYAPTTYANTLNANPDVDADGELLGVNFVGYAGGASRYRDFYVFDGRNGTVAAFSGATKSMTLGGAANFSGDRVILGNDAYKGFVAFGTPHFGASATNSPRIRGYSFSETNAGIEFVTGGQVSSWIDASGYSWFGTLRLKGSDQSATLWQQSGNIGIYAEAGTLTLQGTGGATNIGGALTIASSSSNPTLTFLTSAGAGNGNYLNFADTAIGGQTAGKAFLRWSRDNNEGRSFSIYTSDASGNSIRTLDVSSYAVSIGNDNQQMLTRYDVNGDFSEIQSVHQGVAYTVLKLNPSGGTVSVGGGGLNVAGDLVLGSRFTASPGGYLTWGTAENGGSLTWDAGFSAMVARTGNDLYLGANGQTQTVKVSTAGDIEPLTQGSGVIIKSPNGTRWRITVSDAGVVQATSL